MECHDVLATYGNLLLRRFAGSSADTSVKTLSKHVESTFASESSTCLQRAYNVLRADPLPSV